MVSETYLYTLYWSPEGRPIATVRADCGWSARRKAPQPYRRYIGEVYSVRHDQMSADEYESIKLGRFGKETD